MALPFGDVRTAPELSAASDSPNRCCGDVNSVSPTPGVPSFAFIAEPPSSISPPHERSGTGRIRPRVPDLLRRLLAIVEFGFVMNAVVSIDFATRDAALAAAEAGNAPTPTARPPSPRHGHDDAGQERARERSAHLQGHSNGVAQGPVNVYDRNGRPIAHSLTEPGDRGLQPGLDLL